MLDVEVRLLRFWEARYVKKVGKLMDVDILFLNAKKILTQGTVNSKSFENTPSGLFIYIYRLEPAITDKTEEDPPLIFTLNHIKI
ncbi:hypothetical protein Bca4012_068063 [Brassica carinata]